ncbi:glycosyltransferase involved in cell wall biosynthesis [Flavobacterium sp. PL11]|uniref:glycosyltransferase n=1 Tax=Flavobacterium sp. PL11 TaxID=3071717 RepID=UPI002DF76857|nr:glycosyltransferase involved in cell wall biosynthesis [Flavobacterium sp. PL11]
MAKQYKKIKIAIVGYKLAGGGLERVFSTVSNILQESDCEVYVIVLENEIEYSYSGTLVNLGNYSKFRKYFRLKSCLKSNQFDFIIDFRHRLNPWMELLFMYYVYAGNKFIYTIHSSRVAVYLTSKDWIASLILKKSYKIVTVSSTLKEILNRQFQFNGSVAIPNSIPINFIEENCDNSHLPFQYCIAVGRLVELKQFDKLIDTYSKSILSSKEIHLVILGGGSEKAMLQKQIEQKQMSDFIHLLGFKNDALSHIKNAKYLVLTSKYEGFPMVILEALSAGIPVIAFDCETGPSELIQNEYNGFLVENQNFKALEQALNRFENDNQLYNLCKENSKASIAQFSNEKVARKWLDLLNIKKN